MKTIIGATNEEWCLKNDVEKEIEKAYKEGWYDGESWYDGGDGECYGEFEQDWKESKTFKNLTGK